MPAYSKERENEFIVMLRVLLARSPRITVLGMQEAMRQNGYTLDKDYVNRLMRRVHEEREHRIKTQTLPREVAKFEDIVETLANELWRIILEKDRIENNVLVKGASRVEKIKAIQVLIDAYKDLSNMKFDAGVFERQLGKLKTEEKLNSEDEELMRQALEYALKPSKQNN